MFHQNLLEQILDLPDAPLLMQEVNNRLNDERQRRVQFYNRATNRDIDESMKVEFINGEFEKIMTVFTRNDYEPDIVFFGNEKAKDFKEVQTLFPFPDFVVEILSKSTQKNDRGIKFDDYETHKVAEYWIIDPDSEVVEQYLLKEKRYELNLKSSNGTIKSSVIEGFEIPIRAIFDDKLNFETLQSLLR